MKDSICIDRQKHHRGVHHTCTGAWLMVMVVVVEVVVVVVVVLLLLLVLLGFR